MLGGGLLQLVATGRQDIYLSGNPQTTFFKQVYRRHTNFAVESCRIDFEGSADFGKTFVATVPRKGDLLNTLILEASLPMLPQKNSLGDPDSTSWVNGIGHAMIEYISLEIGGKEIDRQYGESMHIMSQLQVDASKKTGFDNMIGQVQAFAADVQLGPLKLFIPLRFWFCNNIGLSLPLVALQAHPVKIYIKMRSVQSLFYRDTLDPNFHAYIPNQTLNPPPSVESIVLWGDYIHLDTDERRRFVSSKHEYLIEQVQRQNPYSIVKGSNLVNVTLDFNNPIKEIIWVVQQNRVSFTNEWFNYSTIIGSDTGFRPGPDQISTAVIRLDGYDRFEARDAAYFRLVQPWQRHTAIPINDFIYVYSFSLAPEAAQPQGSLNASRIDNIVLSCNMNNAIVRSDSTLTVYGINYNVLRIAAGLGGVLFTA
jgi:hypothetical protein